MRGITKSRRPTGEGEGGKGDSALLVRREREREGWRGEGGESVAQIGHEKNTSTISYLFSS